MSPTTDLASERDHLLDRLQSLRSILPVFAQELASARRQATRLRLENASLTERVRELERQVGTGSHARPDGGAQAAPRRGVSSDSADGARCPVAASA